MTAARRSVFLGNVWVRHDVDRRPTPNDRRRSAAQRLCTITARERFATATDAGIEEVAHLAVQPAARPRAHGRTGGTVVLFERGDVPVDVAARQRHLHDQVMENDVVKDRDTWPLHRLAVDPFVVRVVPELVDGEVETSRDRNRPPARTPSHRDAAATPAAASPSSARCPCGRAGSGERYAIFIASGSNLRWAQPRCAATTSAQRGWALRRCPLFCRGFRLLREICLDEAVQIAVEHAIGVADFVRRCAWSFTICTAAARRSGSGCPSRSPSSRLRSWSALPCRFSHLQLVQPGAQDLHGHRAVLVLRALVLAGHDDPGRQMGDAHRGVGLVDVLPAGAAGAVGVDLADRRRRSRSRSSSSISG